MSFNARAITTLGLGFGALAIATLGFIAEPAQQEQVSQAHGGGVVARGRDHRELTYEELNSRYELLELRRNAQRERDAEAAAAEVRLAAINAVKVAGKTNKTAATTGKVTESDKTPGAAEIDPIVLAAIFDEFF